VVFQWRIEVDDEGVVGGVKAPFSAAVTTKWLAGIQKCRCFELELATELEGNNGWSLDFVTPQAVIIIGHSLVLTIPYPTVLCYLSRRRDYQLCNPK
jgi:hypothetical protein